MDKMDVPQAKRRSFITALYQFLFPLVGFQVDGTPFRLFDTTLVAHIDESIFEELDLPPETPPPSSSTQQPKGSQYKNIGPVMRPPLPPPLATRPASSKAPNRQQDPAKPHGSRKRRTLRAGEPLKKRRKMENTLYFQKLKKQSESNCSEHESHLFVVVLILSSLSSRNRHFLCRPLFFNPLRVFAIDIRSAGRNS
jgi:hypothetical protein